MLSNHINQGHRGLNPSATTFHSSTPPSHHTLTDLTPQAPPDTLNLEEDSHHPDDETLWIAQLNCFNGKTILHNLLADKRFAILILQEPWVDPRTLRLPTHPAWHEFMPYDYHAKSFDERIRTGIYVSKRIPSWLITLLPSRSHLLTAIELKLPSSQLPNLRVIAAYNPPTRNTGLPVLKAWLENHNESKIATLIGRRS